MVLLVLHEHGIYGSLIRVFRIWYPGDSYTCTVIGSYDQIETCFNRNEPFMEGL
jgi:hypothetical protein